MPTLWNKNDNVMVEEKKGEQQLATDFGLFIPLAMWFLLSLFFHCLEILLYFLQTFDAFKEKLALLSLHVCLCSVFFCIWHLVKSKNVDKDPKRRRVKNIVSLFPACKAPLAQWRGALSQTALIPSVNGAPLNSHSIQRIRRTKWKNQIKGCWQKASVFYGKKMEKKL